MRFFDELDMQFVDLDGWMLGLKMGRRCNLIKRPLRRASSCKEIINAIRRSFLFPRSLS